ncbi:DUF2199 domain-containing protein [Streptosporangium sp. NPDC023825]|uniref:DUF2199 domain-containing protein n=1 Tax=Streptosporangium sp. NPDC023825 TaxID=3154909 RepID=UPI00342F2551
MITDAVVTCSCCGTQLSGTDQIDVRFGLPDVALEVAETARHPVNPGLLRVDGHGCFARCLLPVRLSGGVTLMLGTWIRISEDDLERAHSLWDEPAYAGLVFSGTLANAIEPWGQDVMGADLTVVVRDVDEIPYVDASSHPLLSRVLRADWDRDEVLSHFGHALPVPVRTWLNDHWSIERSAGMAARVVEGISQFAGPGRTVYADLRTASGPGTPDEFLASLTEGAPVTDAAHQLTEHHQGGLRHAFWLTSTGPEQPKHELYGFVIHHDEAVALACFHDDPQDLSWAQHVWRSVIHLDHLPAT